jgi:hypothetical protein
VMSVVENHEYKLKNKRRWRNIRHQRRDSTLHLCVPSPFDRLLRPRTTTNRDAFLLHVRSSAIELRRSF